MQHLTDRGTAVETMDERIRKIEMYVLKRQIGIAELLAAEFRNEANPSPLKESGYAILSIVACYFEMIQQFLTGQTSKDNSRKFFVAGFRQVYPDTAIEEMAIRLLYDWIRCGMYHDGMTRQATQLSRHFGAGFAVQNGVIHCNPARVVEDVRMHFVAYIARLRDPASATERTHFATWCEILGVNRPGTVTSSTEAFTKTTRAPWEQGLRGPSWSSTPDLYAAAWTWIAVHAG